jgi:hypothetical protein
MESPQPYVDPQPAPAPDPNFRLEAVVVCDHYSDFLRNTLPENKHLFDRMVVVTSAEDKDTRRLCEFYHVECVPTDVLGTRWGTFCKASGINVGLSALSMEGWVVHLDADIWLPPLTRKLLQAANLDPSMVYGADRFIVKGFRAWDRFKELPALQQEAGAYIHMGAFPVGTRVMQEHFGGYIPIGFFQLWHPGQSKVRRYPGESNNAGRTDLLFAAQWPRAKRALIPEVVGYHLESVNAQFGGNWNGRKSAPFNFAAEEDA